MLKRQLYLAPASPLYLLIMELAQIYVVKDSTKKIISVNLVKTPASLALLILLALDARKVLLLV